MNKTVKRGLLIAAGVVAACGVVWGGLTLARNANRGSVNVYAVSDFSMTDYWGDTSQTSGMVSTDDIQKLYLSDTQKVNKVYVQEGQTVKKGDKLLSYDTTLTSLDVERAQIAYDKQQYELEKAQKEFQRLLKAKDKEKLEDEIKELQDKIDALILKNQNTWYDANSNPIQSVSGLGEGEKGKPLENPKGDGVESNGTKEKPYYFNWNTGDALSEDNLLKLLPEGENEAYVVLVIRKDNRSQHEPVAYISLRLERKADTPDVPGTGGDVVPGGATESGVDAVPGSENGMETGVGEQTMTDPVSQTQGLNYYYEDLPGIAWQEPGGMDDEIRELEEERDALQEIADEAYTAEELPHMIGEKYMAIQEMDRAIKLAKLNLDQVKKEVGSDTVYSELDGTIKAVRDSNSAEFDKSQAVVEVSGGGGYYIDGAVSELELGTVSIGETVQINSWMTGASCEGEIVEISDYPTDNANSWSDGNSNVSYYPFKVFVTEDADLQEGDWVEMSYQNTSGSADGNTLYLESMFIRTENGKSYVMVRGENGKLEQRWVQTGRNLWGSYTQIRGGLTLEDFVAFPYGRDVTEGAGTVEATQDQLYNGM